MKRYKLLKTPENEVASAFRMENTDHTLSWHTFSALHCGTVSDGTRTVDELPRMMAGTKSFDAACPPRSAQSVEAWVSKHFHLVLAEAMLVARCRRRDACKLSGFLEGWACAEGAESNPSAR